MNIVVLTGRLGRDPERRESKQGKTLCRFSLATTRPTRDRETDWHSCTVLREETARSLLEHAHKGDALSVTGSLQYWNDKDDKPRAEIVVDRWEFSSAGGRNNGQQQQAKRDDEPAANSPADVDFPF